MKRRHSATSSHCYLSLTSSRFLSSLLPVLCARTASTTETMLPRRFRTRVLFAVILIGVCLLISAYYAPDSHLMIKVREPARFWTLLWSATENCPVHSPEPAADRWNTAELYPKLDFRVPDNGGMGFWNDALEKRYREIRENWKDLPLKVIIVPHSHVDPGWLRTFDDYHISLVSDILDNMVKFLNKTEDFKFIWSEISYFAKWWEKQNEVTRSVVKKILQRQQLEFVTGGWVMPDEAITSYFATIDQLIEGHQWLQHSLGTLPKRGWSVDVFGHSGSYPYILSSAGISEIVIMRTHYAWKKFFAESQAFDFYWEQPFHSPRVLCHMAPSDLYSFKYACGPDPVICLKFDFRQIDREYSESTADKITDQNVENKAGYLLSQYGRFASLLPHNVLLVPLGDDFRYNVEIEWVQQLENYKKLFNFINNKKDWNVHIQFGTVSDYFNEVNNRMYNNLGKPLKSVEGDFLPYADIYANFRPSYWTGFYTTRPFYKKLSQELEYWLRTSEILYSLAKTLVSKSFQKILSDDYAFLISARQKLALFQHHDAITGTSKEIVMRDYGKKLHTGIIDAMSVVSHATQLLMMEHLLNSQHWTSQIYPDVYRSAFDQPTKKLSIAVPDNGRKIILFNSLTVERTEMVRIRVKTPLLKVIDSNLQDVPFQINPVFKDQLTISSTVFELLFVAFLKPLSYTVYTIVGIQDSDREKLPKTVILLSFNNDAEEPPMHSAFTFEKKNDEPIKLDSQKISATFSHYGHLKSIYLKESGLFTSLDIDFLTYHSWMYRSGAYLFNPDTAAVPVRNQTDHFPLLSVIRGPLMSELKITHHNILMFSIRIFNYENASTALQLEVTSDVSKMAEDVELIMRIKSDVKNEGIFYTDSNGFQMLKRMFVSRLPVQGNYYPATSAVFIEDENMRMNVLLPHSHGVTCTNGQIEVMLDRKIHNDDGRGVGEGVEDSRVSSAVFWLLPESQFSKQSNIQLSTDAFWLSLFLSHPPTILVPEHSKMDFIKSHLSFLEGSWPYDVHLINLRTLPQEDYNLPSNDSLMIIYQKHLTCPSKAFTDLMINEIDHHSPFSIVKVKSIVKTSLTGTSVISHDVDSLTPQLLQSCKITFQK